MLCAAFVLPCTISVEAVRNRDFNAFEASKISSKYMNLFKSLRLRYLKLVGVWMVSKKYYRRMFYQLIFNSETALHKTERFSKTFCHSSK